jgi:hypothetical protein
VARSRFFALTALVLALALNADQAARTEERQPASNPTPRKSVPSSQQGRGDPTCVIYPLDELGVDREFGDWIAQTIPEVLEPGTWKSQTASMNPPYGEAYPGSNRLEAWKPSGVLRYNAAKNILVVYQTPAMQTKVEEFLKDLKKSLPRKKSAGASARHSSTQATEVAPAEYRVPALLKASGSAPEQSSSYPVAPPVKAPKHLFHFIIRYEGEGIIDDNVVKFTKIQAGGDKSGTAVNAPSVSSVSSAIMGSLVTPAAYTTAPIPSSGTGQGPVYNTAPIPSSTTLPGPVLLPSAAPIAPASATKDKTDTKGDPSLR